MGIGSTWGTREELLHPRDKHGRFRKTWRMAEKVIDLISELLERFSPRTFGSQDQANSYVFNQANAPGRKRFNDYATLGDFLDANDALRAGRDDEPTKRFVATMDRSKAPLPDDLILTTSMSPDAFGLTPETMHAEEGGIEDFTGKLIADRGYLSTKIGNPVRQPGDITLTVATSKGTQAIIPGRGRADPEVILDRDQELRITKVDPDGSGGYYVYAVATPRTPGETPAPISRPDAGASVQAREARIATRTEGERQRGRVLSDTEIAQQETERAQRAQQAGQPAGQPGVPPQGEDEATRAARRQQILGRPAPTEGPAPSAGEGVSPSLAEVPTPEPVKPTQFRVSQLLREAGVDGPGHGENAYSRALDKAQFRLRSGENPREVADRLEEEARNFDASSDAETSRIQIDQDTIRSHTRRGKTGLSALAKILRGQQEDEDGAPKVQRPVPTPTARTPAPAPAKLAPPVPAAAKPRLSRERALAGLDALLADLNKQPESHEPGALRGVGSPFETVSSIRADVESGKIRPADVSGSLSMLSERYSRRPAGTTISTHANRLEATPTSTPAKAVPTSTARTAQGLPKVEPGVPLPKPRPRPAKAAKAAVPAAEKSDLDAPIAQLREISRSEGVNLKGITRKADIQAAIRAHRENPNAPQVVAPVKAAKKVAAPKIKTDLDGTLPELRAIAKDEGVNLKGVTRKADIQAAIRAHRDKTKTPQEPGLVRVEGPRVSAELVEPERQNAFIRAWNAGVPSRDDSIGRQNDEIFRDIRDGKFTPAEGVRRLETEIELNQAELDGIGADLTNPNLSREEFGEATRRQLQMQTGLASQRKALQTVRDHFRLEPREPDKAPGRKDDPLRAEFVARLADGRLKGAPPGRYSSQVDEAMKMVEDGQATRTQAADWLDNRVAVNRDQLDFQRRRLNSPTVQQENPEARHRIQQQIDELDAGVTAQEGVVSFLREPPTPETLTMRQFEVRLPRESLDAIEASTPESLREGAKANGIDVPEDLTTKQQILDHIVRELGRGELERREGMPSPPAPTRKAKSAKKLEEGVKVRELDETITPSPSLDRPRLSIGEIARDLDLTDERDLQMLDLVQQALDGDSFMGGKKNPTPVEIGRKLEGWNESPNGPAGAGALGSMWGDPAPEAKLRAAHDEARGTEWRKLAERLKATRRPGKAKAPTEVTPVEAPPTLSLPEGPGVRRPPHFNMGQGVAKQYGRTDGDEPLYLPNRGADQGLVHLDSQLGELWTSLVVDEREPNSTVNAVAHIGEDVGTGKISLDEAADRLRALRVTDQGVAGRIAETITGITEPTPPPRIDVPANTPPVIRQWLEDLAQIPTMRKTRFPGSHRDRSVLDEALDLVRQISAQTPESRTMSAGEAESKLSGLTHNVHESIDGVYHARRLTGRAFAGPTIVTGYRTGSTGRPEPIEEPNPDWPSIRDWFRGRRATGPSTMTRSRPTSSPRGQLRVRESLAGVQDHEVLAKAATDEYKRITGRDITVDFGPPETRVSISTAKDHLEGVLRVAERFPDTRLRKVTYFDHPGDQGWAYSDVHGTLEFNLSITSVDGRGRYLKQLRASVFPWQSGGVGYHPRGADTPIATAAHEMGHMVDFRIGHKRHHDEIVRLLVRRSQDEKITPFDLISREVSGYAAEDGVEELIGEVFADITVNGSGASQLSREIYGIIRRAYETRKK